MSHPGKESPVKTVLLAWQIPADSKFLRTQVPPCACALNGRFEFPGSSPSDARQWSLGLSDNCDFTQPGLQQSGWKSISPNSHDETPGYPQEEQAPPETRSAEEELGWQLFWGQKPGMLKDAM